MAADLDSRLAAAARKLYAETWEADAETTRLVAGVKMAEAHQLHQAARGEHAHGGFPIPQQLL